MTATVILVLAVGSLLSFVAGVLVGLAAERKRP